MRNVTYTGIFVAAAFIAGAFIASPELRAYAANTVFSTDIKDGEVKTPDLANNAVTSAKIKDGEVKTADIATGAVAAGRIADGAVGTLKIADDSIMAVDIQADAVGASEIAANAVGASEIAANSVDGSKIVDGSVGRAEIGTNQIDGDEIDGISKLIFNECFGSSGTILPPGSIVGFSCFVPGASDGDNVIATRNSGLSACFDVAQANTLGRDKVIVTMRNNCASNTFAGTAIQVSIIVYRI